MELSHACVGRGNRCARAAIAVGTHLKISEKSQRAVKLAASLHHIGMLSHQESDPDELAAALTILDNIPSFKTVTPIIANAFERLDGSGPNGLTDDDMDLETRIVAVAAAFEQATSGNYDVDMIAVIDTLEQDVGLDTDVVAALRNAHLDGSLYQSGVTPVKQEQMESEEI